MTQTLAKKGTLDAPVTQEFGTSRLVKINMATSSKVDKMKIKNFGRYQNHINFQNINQQTKGEYSTNNRT